MLFVLRFLIATQENNLHAVVIN